MAMEFIDPSISITKSDLLALHRECWMKELKRLVGGFHAIDLVHSDLQDANIIRKGDSVMLVDFHIGKVGEAFYPMLELNPELLEGRTSDSFDITKDDDVRVLTKTN
jgi:tRNA A-37 threonylcarbamoyl transferase component Bud32